MLESTLACQARWDWDDVGVGGASTYSEHSLLPLLPQLLPFTTSIVQVEYVVAHRIPSHAIFIRRGSTCYLKSRLLTQATSTASSIQATKFSGGRLSLVKRPGVEPSPGPCIAAHCLPSLDSAQHTRGSGGLVAEAAPCRHRYVREDDTSHALDDNADEIFWDLRSYGVLSLRIPHPPAPLISVVGILATDPISETAPPGRGSRGATTSSATNGPSHLLRVRPRHNSCPSRYRFYTLPLGLNEWALVAWLKQGLPSWNPLQPFIWARQALKGVALHGVCAHHWLPPTRFMPKGSEWPRV